MSPCPVCPCVPPCAPVCPVCGAAGSMYPLITLPVAIIRLNTELRPSPSKLRAAGKV